MSRKQRQWQAAKEHLVESGVAAPTDEQIRARVKAEHKHTRHTHARKKTTPTRQRRLQKTP